MSFVTRVETHFIRKSDPFYDWASNEFLLSRNLYNRTLYIYRQAFTGKHENIPEYSDIIKNERFVGKFEVRKRMSKLNDIDYRAIHKSHSANQVIAQVDTIWKAWFKALNAYKKNPSKFTGRPKMPKYKKEGVPNILIYDKDDARLQKDGSINISKTVKIPVFTKVTKLQEVRLIPSNNHIKVEIVYRKEVDDKGLNKDNALGIDLGLNNLMAVTSNEGSISSLVNGRPLKAINHYYNKKKAHYTSILNKHGKKFSKRLKRLEAKRMMKIKDYLHKASRRVVEMMIDNDIGTCVFGHNKGWKQEINLGKVTNQNFVQIPFNNLIQMVQYKIEDIGGEFIVKNEAYSSKCSFLDDEKIGKKKNYAGKRTKRGLFVTGNKKAINADINGSLNIIKLGTGKSFSVKSNVFNPTKIDVNVKLSPAMDK